MQMHRVQPEDWQCPICSARGWCTECSGLGTYEAYQKTQDLHAAAIKKPDGLAARVLEAIEFLPELRDRGYWVSRMIDGALRNARMS